MQASEVAGDNDTLRDLLLGNVRACRHLENYVRKIVGHAFGRLQPPDVDDIVQLSLMDLYALASKPDFRLERSLYGLLRRIAIARCIDLTRRRRNQVDILDELPSAAPSPLDELDLEDQVARLRVALDRLDPKCRHLIRVRSLDGASYRDLAATFGRAEATIRVWHHNCLGRLRTLLLRADAVARQQARNGRATS